MGCGQSPLPLSVAVSFLALAARAVQEEDVYRALDALHVRYDTGAVRRAAAESAARTVDPGAAILPADEPAPPETAASVAAAEEWPEGLRYLRLRGLHADAASGVVARVADWSAGGRAAGLILDLRGAGGANLAAVDAAGALFATPEAELYWLRDSAGGVLERRRAPAGPAPAARLPVMLLMDSETRGAGEALAAVLKGRPGVMLIGGRTRGDAGLRVRAPLTANTVLSVATAWIVPASGTEYDRVGVAPDLAVSNGVAGAALAAPPGEDDGRRPRSGRARQDQALMQRVGGDPWLSRATDILLAVKALHERTPPAAGPPPAAAGGPDGAAPPAAPGAPEEAAP